MHAFVGVKAACGGAVAGIDADERIRVGLLNGIPAFFGDVNGVGGSRVQNDAPSVLGPRFADSRTRESGKACSSFLFWREVY